MIALYIILGIVLLITVLLNCPVKAAISYIDNKLDITVKYLFFTLYPVKEKKSKKTDETDEPQKTDEIKEETFDENSEEKTTSTEDAKSLTEEPKKLTREEKKRLKKIEKRHKAREKEELKEKIELIMTLVKSSGKGVKKLISGIKIYDIAIDIDVANEDAFDAAIGYGKMNILVFNALSFLRTFFTISLEHVNISCIYNSSECRYDGKCCIHASPAKALGAAISISTRFGLAILKKRRLEKKAAKEMNKSPQMA